MSKIAKLDKLASAFEKAIAKNKVIEQAARSAKDPALYTRENRRINLDETKKEVAAASAELRQKFLDDIKAANEKIDKYYQRTRAGNDPYNFMRAERINQAKTMEEGEDIYRRQLNRMDSESRQKYRFAYDDALEELQARLEPAAVSRVEKVIDEYRTNTEKAHIDEAKLTMAMFNQFPTLSAAIEMNLNDLENGEEPAAFQWAQILNEIKVNAIRNIYGTVKPEMAINPYLTEAQEPAAEIDS
jgi:regulatory protein YycH of two-component signal transduction system YycFG